MQINDTYFANYVNTGDSAEEEWLFKPSICLQILGAGPIGGKKAQLA